MPNLRQYSKVNTSNRYYHKTTLIDETFRKLGRWVVSCHAKDVYGREGQFAESTEADVTLV